MVKTQGIPLWNGSMHNSTAVLIEAGGTFLKWLGHLHESQTLGLSDGSLYDVLTSTYSGSGTAQVSATGFDITCGYIANFTVKATSQFYDIVFRSMTPEGVLSLPKPYHPDGNAIVTAQLQVTDSIILYTQNSVLDSEGNTGFRMNLNSDVSLQFIQCSKSLVSQIATVSINSGVILSNSLEPKIQKAYSIWQSYDSLPKTINGTTLLESNYWAEILSSLPDSEVAFRPDQLFSGDAYLMAQLGLIPVDSSTSLQHLQKYHIVVVPLRNEEFAVGGHIHFSEVPLPLDSWDSHPPVLQSGNAMAQKLVPTARLNISLAACSIGLGASIMLLILAIIFSAPNTKSNFSLTSLGFLQLIWVFEHHPELSEILEHVEDPTDYNLRTAGLVKVIQPHSWKSDKQQGERTQHIGPTIYKLLMLLNSAALGFLELICTPDPADSGFDRAQDQRDTQRARILDPLTCHGSRGLHRPFKKISVNSTAGAIASTGGSPIWLAIWYSETEVIFSPMLFYVF
ncbi:hypothetical protein B0H13DRAFT_1859447 [Mycena leptocephala]|nr:hypothetical protein B0H13DRAFT_1859447 [Mycena leptocephala]